MRVLYLLPILLLGVTRHLLPAPVDRDSSTRVSTRATHLMTAFYLSPTGSDTADGTSPQTAWQTLSRSNKQTFRPGDQLLLEGGATFRGMLLLTSDDAGTPANPVIITSFGMGRATIQNPDSSAIRVQDAGGIIVKNLIVAGQNGAKNRGYGVQFINTRPRADQRVFVRIDHIDASGFGRDGIFLGGQPADSTQSGFTDVVIADCVLSKNQYHGLFVTGIWNTRAVGYANHRIKVERVTATDNTGDPLFLENHSGSGMEIDDVEDAEITHCAAYRNGFLCNSRVGGPCGIWLHAANRSVIHHCVAIGNRTGNGLDGAGFDLDGGTTFCRIEHCYARDNDGAGILVWNYADAPHRLGDNVICYNILEDNGKTNRYGDIHIGTGGTPITNLRVYQNTVFSTRQLTGNQRCVWIEGKPNGAIQFWNNLFIINGSIPFVTIESGQPNTVLAGNVFWAIDGKKRAVSGGQFMEPRLSATRTGESPTPQTLATLRGYRPRPGSPLATAGVSLTGKSRGGPVDDLWGIALADKAVGAGMVSP